jgi:hypothetical protein
MECLLPSFVRFQSILYHPAAFEERQDIDFGRTGMATGTGRQSNPVRSMIFVLPLMVRALGLLFTFVQESLISWMRKNRVQGLGMYPI